MRLQVYVTLLRTSSHTYFCQSAVETATWQPRWTSRSTEIRHCCMSDPQSGHTYPQLTLTSPSSYWILLPITVVMILTGILRHYMSTLLQTTPKRQIIEKLREQRYLLRAQGLRVAFPQISKSAFEKRKEWWIDNAKEGKFLADPEARGAKPNPISDPAMMENMMGAMKGNVAMMVPQSLIMGWINAFFSGYVISMSSCDIWTTARQVRKC